jgi:hypothetical protein
MLARLQQFFDGVLGGTQAGVFAVEDLELAAFEFELDVGAGVSGMDLCEHRAFLAVDLAADIVKLERSELFGEPPEPPARLNA